MGKSLVIATILLFLQTAANAYDNITVHLEINENSIKISRNIGSVLQSIGFNHGIDTSINYRPIYEWLRIGGREEDVPGTNGRLHFHDPLKSWDEAGFWENPLFDISESSIFWSQENLTQENQWSWPQARNYYYQALTAKDKTTREARFANSFQAVGQVMHLLADSSVPAHTRNDLHFWPQTIAGTELGRHTYETWAQKNVPSRNYPVTPLNYSLTRLAVFNPEAPQPISAFWDLDRYNGSDPEQSLTTPIGLAEYTNANFFSEDTIFSDYPNPSRDNTNILSAMNHPEIVDGEDGKFDSRVYVRSTANGTGHKLAAFSYLSFDCISSGYSQITPFVLDDQVYADYAALLVPRAIGYASGLLDYFFRGTLEISAPQQFAYAIADAGQTPQQFTSIKAKVRNTTPYEEASYGIIQAVAHYRKRIDYQEDLSTDPPQPSSREKDFSYSVSRPVPVSSLDSTLPSEFTFDFSASPIPAGITDLRLQVIFRGTLGMELNDAIAVGMKDIAEPMQIAVWNVTDRFYLDHHLRAAEEIKADPLLLSRVDHDSDGQSDEYINPYPLQTRLAFSLTSNASGPYPVTYESLPAGGYGKVMILTGLTPFYLHIERVSTTPDDFYASWLALTPTINQDEDGIFISTDVDTFRGVTQQQWTAFIRYYPDAEGIVEAEWPAPENNPCGQGPCPPTLIR